MAGKKAKAPRAGGTRASGRLRAVIILSAAVVVYVLINNVPASSQAGDVWAETHAVINLNYEDRADIYSCAAKGFFLTTKDGCNFYTSEKEIKWAFAYPVSLKEPLMAGNGLYVGVSDASGQVFYMFSNEGLIYAKNYEDIVLSFYVSSGGYVSIMVRSGNDYVIQVLGLKGEEINYYNSRSANIFPTSSSVSPDGRILAISVVDISHTVMESKLMLLYNNASEKQPWLNGIYYQSSMEDELIARMEFIADNELVYLTDSSLACLTADVAGSSTPKEKWHMPLNNKIDSVAISQGRVIAIAYGEPLPGADAMRQGAVELYDTNLRKIGEYEFSGDVSLTSCAGFIIAGSGRHYTAFNNRGKRVWEYNSIADVKKMAVLENQNTVLTLENLRAQVIKRR